MVQSGSGSCDACGAKAGDCSDSTDEASGLPKSWFVRIINEREYSLCDCCGSILQFKGGMSPYLQDALGLGQDARCEVVDEVKVLAAARAERRKAGRRKA